MKRPTRRAAWGGGLLAATGALLVAPQGGPAAAAPVAPLLGAAVTLPSRLAVVEIDNSHADSWLEVDRTGNVQNGAGGEAGNDHVEGDRSGEDEVEGD
ncbi:hypothetical protein ACFV3R_07870 [Streptomyces sp. NPDC059740]|uniref:hypothetical protein n=1 Tax=Streptomyces sp. NPDC059740 TaxID=3346926 RepID=UPI003650AE8E